MLRSSPWLLEQEWPQRLPNGTDFFHLSKFEPHHSKNTLLCMSFFEVSLFYRGESELLLVRTHKLSLFSLSLSLSLFSSTHTRSRFLPHFNGDRIQFNPPFFLPNTTRPYYNQWECSPAPGAEKSVLPQTLGTSCLPRAIDIDVQDYPQVSTYMVQIPTLICI